MCLFFEVQKYKKKNKQRVFSLSTPPRIGIEGPYLRRDYIQVDTFPI